MDQIEHITQVHPDDSLQKFKRCDMHGGKECITKYNVQNNTHAHTHVNKSLPQKTPTNNTHLLFTLYCPH